jgi:uncharacterized protein YndB with AHSA1/START domain
MARARSSRDEGQPAVSNEEGIVEATVRIAARAETAWRYWTDPRRMCAWWGAAADFNPRPGGACTVEMDGGAVMRGEYVELVPHERIVFTFGWDPTKGAPDIPAGSTRVEVTLTADGDDTILALRHTGLPAAFRALHRDGWGHFLPLLVSAAAPSSN